MRILDYFQSWQTAQIVLTALAAGAAVVVMGGVLSVFVVLKRLAFIGQGVSHSAFGGIGVAAVVGALTGATWAAQGGMVEFAIVVLFCIAAALGMAAVGDEHSGGSGGRKALHVDTGIGLFLVASMALGGLLIEAARSIAVRSGHPIGVRSWESILFGSILTAGWGDAILAAALAAVILLVLWIFRRPLVFWAFDQTSAPAFGVPGVAMRTLLMVLLAIATVTAMKLTGVVLATTLLVLPGAIALKLGRSLAGVLAISIAVGLGGLALGLWLSIEADVQPGPCIVLVLTGMFAAALVASRARTVSNTPIPTGASA